MNGRFAWVVRPDMRDIPDDCLTPEGRKIKAFQERSAPPCPNCAGECDAWVFTDTPCDPRRRGDRAGRAGGEP